MNRNQIRAMKRQVKRDNSTRPEYLVNVPRVEWPSHAGNLIRVLRSKHFLVQVFIEENSIRLSINRTEVDDNLKWKENITWEELQDLKRQAGYGDRFAVEIYPKDCDVVNVANMRHLWIIEDVLGIGWKK